MATESGVGLNRTYSGMSPVHVGDLIFYKDYYWIVVSASGTPHSNQIKVKRCVEENSKQKVLFPAATSVRLSLSFSKPISEEDHRTAIAQYISGEGDENAEGVDPVSLQKDSVRTTNGFLDLREKLISEDHRSSFPGKHLITPKAAFDALCEATDVPTWLDLSRNYFTPTDIKDVAQFVKTKALSCQVVDLSYCWLSADANDDFETIMTSVANFLVIIGNPAASVDNAAWLGCLHARFLEKLIWVPQEWLGKGGWKRIVTAEPLQAVVEKAHTSYLCMINAFQQPVSSVSLAASAAGSSSSSSSHHPSLSSSTSPDLPAAQIGR